MLTALLDVCLQQNIRPKPERVMADFEKAIQNAARSTLNHDGNLHVQGCFYHLTQSTWRRVQSEGLQNDYHNSEAVKEFCGKIDGLAFLPECDVKEGIAILYDEVPDNLRCLVEYFDATYVNGPLRAVEVAGSVNLRFRRLPPMYPPVLWNVHQATLQDRDRTNNQCESWNNAFKYLVGCANPSLWHVIYCLNEDAILSATDIIRCERGVLTKKRVKRGTTIHKQKLKRLCNQYSKQEKNPTTIS